MKLFYKKNGFGLLEVLISSGILILFISSAVNLSQLSLKNSVISVDRTQAYLLAQESLEIARQMRDSTWLDQNVNRWNKPFNIGGVFIGGPYKVYKNIASAKIELILGNESIPLDGKVFTRSLYIESVSIPISGMNIPNPDSDPSILKLKSNVNWTEYNQDWSISSETYLSDWKPAF